MTGWGDKRPESLFLENYPGWAGSGSELAEFMNETGQKPLGRKLCLHLRKALMATQTADLIFCVIMARRYVGRTVIIATGASPRRLQIEGAREFMGKGVSYCATCDGFFYHEKDVIVLGGGNSALNDALYLADLAKSVKIVYRKGAFTRAEAVLRNRVAERET